MKNAMTRIKSERGASILAALLLVLVLTTVSAIILIYASADYGRLPGRLEEKQRKAGLISAAALLRDGLDQESVTVRTTTTTTVTYDAAGHVLSTTTGNVKTRFSSDPSGMIEKFTPLQIFAGTSLTSSLAAAVSVSDSGTFGPLEADISLYKNISNAIIIEADIHPDDDTDHIYVYWAVSDGTTTGTSTAESTDADGHTVKTVIDIVEVTYTFSAENITEVKSE